MGGRGSMRPDVEAIHNGADDNASGTAALLEAVRAFAEGEVRPRRTIVFIAFAGEELGLLGSRHYVRHAAIPIERTVAMINLDMVGRNDPGRIFIGGTLGGGLERAVAQAAEAVGIETERMREGRASGASDHASFERAGVPTLFLFSGMHSDYHRVSDHAERILAEKIAKAARMAVLTAAFVADDPASGRKAAPAARQAAREPVLF
jgi:Zn-dependent M28 family amino/carboxypeptidase